MPRVDDSLCFGGEWGCPSPPLTFPMVPRAHLQDRGRVLQSLRGRDGSVLSLHPSSCSTRHHTALPPCHLSANLIPVTSSPSCPHHHRAPTWPHSYPTASPPVHPHSPHPHTIPTTSVPFSPHHLSLFTSISPQWSITTSVPISSPSPQLCAVPTTSMPPFVPPQPHAVIVFPTPSHSSPQPHTAPVPAPVPTHSRFIPPSPQPHNALTTSAPSCHLSIPTHFIPSLSPLLQLHLVPITSVPSLYRPLSPSLPTITLTPILAAPPLPPSCPRHPGPTSRPFPARLTAPLTLPPLLPPKRQSARQLSAPPSPRHHWLILRTSRLPFDRQPVSQPAAPPSWPRPLPPSVERAGPGGDARGEGSNSCLETRREAP